MNPTWLLLIAIFAPVACGLAGMLLPREQLAARVFTALLGPAAALALLAWHVVAHGTGATLPVIEWMPLLKLDLQLNADQLGLFFAFLVSGIGFLIVLYARAYFGKDAESLFRFYPSLMLFMTAMVGVALADNFMLLLMFWEMTSISSFLLIGWERDKPDAVRNAMQAFVVTGAGGLAMMAGLILTGFHTGHWAFSELLANVGTLQADSLTTAGFVLIFIGAAAKSAQIPLHFWLPGAMAAPTPVSAYLHSATMVKAGVYLVGRMWPIFAVILPVWPSIIVPLGAATMVYGAFIAFQKFDLKQIFAYTTVSQLGLLMCMYGLAHYTYHGEQNLIWDVTQILNHAIYKAPLFILAGAIGHVASRMLPELRGLFWRGRTERIMTVVLLLAGYALAAGPFTVSFTAKEMFFYQIYHAKEAIASPWFWSLVAAGIVTGMFNVAIFWRLTVTLMRKPAAAAAHGEHHGHDHDAAHGAHAAHGHGEHEHETGLWPAFLWIPGLLIVSLQYIGGIVPGAYEAMFGWLEPNMLYFEHFPLVWDAHWGLPLQMSLFAMAAGTLLGLGVGLNVIPLFQGEYSDPFDKAYPGFYLLTTKGGGRLFGMVQTGHAATYIALSSLAMIALFAWSIDFDFAALTWPVGAVFEQVDKLTSGYVITGMVCLTSLLLPMAKSRVTRVLVLGAVGFSVTGVYFVYKAPDLALTQVSIEIVSLILFLLVLSLLPDEAPPRRRNVAPRAVLAVGVGAVMFWVTLTSSVGPVPGMPYAYSDSAGATQPYGNLGAFFMRNSKYGLDTTAVREGALVGGVVDRGAAHAHSFGAHGADYGAPMPNAERPAVLHKGGGGHNVVNVILVDFRGFDTMGEITVLGLAALGVWTLLRKRRADRARDAGDENWNLATRPRAQQHGQDAPGTLRVDIPDPTGAHDAEDDHVARLQQGSAPSA